MLNLTEFYYLNSTTITFNFSDCRTNNFIGFFQTLKKNSKIIEVVATKNSMTLFYRLDLEYYHENSRTICIPSPILSPS